MRSGVGRMLKRRVGGSEVSVDPSLDPCAAPALCSGGRPGIPWARVRRVAGTGRA